MSDGLLPYIKQHFKVYYMSSPNTYMTILTFSLNKRNLLFNKSKIKVSVMFQIYVTMATKDQTIGNFTLKTLFPRLCIYFQQNSILIIHTNDNDNQYLINQC